MFQKAVLNFFNFISIAVHISVIIILLSIPVLFIVQAEKPPVFKVSEVIVAEPDASDTNISSLSGTPSDFYKISYNISAKSGRFSPYSFKIENFVLKYPSELRVSEDYALTLDAPVSCSNSSEDNFILTLYVKKNNIGNDIKSFISKTGFASRNVKRSFSFFKKDIKIFLPHIYMFETDNLTVTIN